MKEQAANQESDKIVVIDINLTGGLAMMLAAMVLLAATLGALVWGQQEAVAASLQAPASSVGMRQYYLTIDWYHGVDADGTDGNGAGVCAVGYHFASLWEISDPSNLKYNTDLGLTADDSGQGPPTDPMAQGWVRTGYSSATSTTPGVANCGNWADPGANGTVAILDWTWDSAGTFPPWIFVTETCGMAILEGVWCVED